MNHLLSRTAETHHQTQSYRLSFFEDCTRKTSPAKIIGRISYLFNGRESGHMSQGDPFMIRASWHRLCRINRGRNAGRDYLTLINHMDNRERRVLGHPPA